jgi:hypothetical protein
MEILFGLFIILFFATFFTILIPNVAEWFKNNDSPRLTVPAKVVTKRSSHHHHHHSHGGMHHSTHYHVTFEVESGDRMELSVSGHEYGMLAESDTGRLTFQGTRYLGFERN